MKGAKLSAPTDQQSIGRVDTQIDQLGEVPPRFAKRVGTSEKFMGTIGFPLIRPY